MSQQCSCHRAAASVAAAHEKYPSYPCHHVLPSRPHEARQDREPDAAQLAFRRTFFRAFSRSSRNTSSAATGGPLLSPLWISLRSSCVRSSCRRSRSSRSRSASRTTSLAERYRPLFTFSLTSCSSSFVSDTFMGASSTVHDSVMSSFVKDGHHIGYFKPTRRRRRR